MQMVKTLWPEQLFKPVSLNLQLPLPASHHLQKHSRCSTVPQTLVAMLEGFRLMLMLMQPQRMLMVMRLETGTETGLEEMAMAAAVMAEAMVVVAMVVARVGNGPE
jgi:hypothetical protein